MLLALTDHLRCTDTHSETWLVARADTAERGWMVEGVLGCPVCHVERTVRAGVVAWSETGADALVAGPSAPAADPDAVIRLAALLAFADSHAPYILCGAAGAYAAALGGLATAPVVLLEPPDDSSAGLASVIRGAPRVPFADRSVQGIALDATHSAADRIEFAVRSLVAGGRMVADAAVPVPAGIRELARDAAQWVGERVMDPVTVPLARAAR